MEHKIVTGLMLMFTLMLIGGITLPIMHYGPRKLDERKARKIAEHAEAVTALETALARAGNDPAQQARLVSSLNWHRSALATLAPDMATARPASSLPLAA